MDQVPVVLVVVVDLRVVASIDKELDRIGVVSGASIYPFAWNILLSARNEGLGWRDDHAVVGKSEPVAKEFLGLEDWEAVCGLLPIGKPTKQLTKLSRKPVSEEFVSSRTRRRRGLHAVAHLRQHPQSRICWVASDHAGNRERYARWPSISA